MKRIFSLALIISLLMVQVSSAAVIIQSQALQQAASATKDQLSYAINTQYSVMELPNGEHDGKTYGIVNFGSYVQEHGSTNKTPIEWYILEKRNNLAILLAKNVLDTHSYDKKDKTDVWNTSRLKMWMNDTFFNNAFTQSEQELIRQNPYRNVGRIFLLTPTEAKYYFDGAREYLSIALPTTRVMHESNYGAYKYWLQGQGDDDGIQYINGRLSAQKNYIDPSQKLGIRPCIVVEYNINLEQKALLQPDAMQVAEQVQVPQATIDPVSGTVVVPQANAATPLIMYESDRTTQVFNYTTDDDDDNTKIFIIKIILPIYAGSDAGKVAYMNNLVQTQGYEILKSYATDYIESRISSVKKQITLVPKPITELGNGLYSVRYEVGTNFICNMYFDLKTGSCYSDTE